jgi:hypothetical protein
MGSVNDGCVAKTGGGLVKVAIVLGVHTSFQLTLLLAKSHFAVDGLVIALIALTLDY